jgi:predicted Zn-dependent protease
LLLIAVFALTAYAEAPNWVQWLPGTSPAISALYRMVPSLGGSIPVRRPPKETAPQLAMLSAGTPSDTELIAATAREYESLLDFKNAEDRWKLLDSVSSDRVASQIELADYYHRRMQPAQELQALTTAESRLPAIDDPLKPEPQQRAWQLHERAQLLIQAQAMPAAEAIRDFDTWIATYPKSAVVQQRYFDFLLDAGIIARAEQILNQYERTFPNDRVALVRQKTKLAEKRGSPGGAIAVYEASYDALWPKELLDGYFRLLVESHRIFDFYQSARRDAVARPLDLQPATLLFHYYRHESDMSAARRELAEFRLRKEAARATWTVSELQTLATLSELTNDHDEAIRYSYALYSLPGAGDAAVEDALVRIISVLLKAPDQPIRFGKGDLSFYRDIATMDASPGFLNGIVSLIFNSQYPDSRFRSQEAKSQAYFHRAKAAELYTLLSMRFPKSTRRSELLSRLIECYALYGEDDAIIRQGTAFIADFPNAEQRTKVALQVADAYARRKQVTEELAVYNRLLGELAAKAQQVPLGTGQPRSPEYAQVLQRYVSRLRQLNRIGDALALYRAEIDRNPNDPGLYDALVAFLGSNPRAPEIEQVYRRAMQRFPDSSWRHKLARYYLRNRMASELQTLSHEMVDTFSGSEVESYVADIVPDGSLDRRLQLEINLYAANRFPHDLRFVHNLIGLYSSGVTADSTAVMRLLSQHCYDDENLRRTYFERLAGTGSLSTVVQTASALLPPASATSWPDAEAANPAVTRFLAEAAAWQSHFESASTIMRAVAAAYPSDTLFAGRASELYRSLAAYESSYASIAASIAQDLSLSQPRDMQRITRVGEIYADQGMFTEATQAWSKIPAIEPGKPGGYLETATAFWDYLRPADALTWLKQGRTQLKDNTLWAYEAGAILESQDQRQQAVTEYMQGAFTAQGNASQSRLLRLATRSDYKTIVDDQTKRRVDTSPADPNALRLRVAALRAQKRDSELEPLLQQIATRTSSREILSYIENLANETNMRAVQERILRREVQLESDPKEKLRLGLEIAHFLEAGGDTAAARTQFESIYQANTLISGVIRATADFYWRHDKPQAVRVLAAAAAKADPSLKKDYLVETVHKAIEAKELGLAAQSAQELLRMDPIDGQHVALMADVLSASNRQSELQQLYTAKIAEIQQSKISQADKTDRIAAMRRGLIPVLERGGKFTEAVDQFIEIVNRFPDDPNLLSDAGRFATQHGLRDRLTGYYARTSAGSPKDPRWFIVLARLQTQFENDDAAIDAYSKAMIARPERLDLAIARADLQERTFKFADAIVSYNGIYELSHKVPIWLEHVARLQARLGQNQEAVASLRQAYIDNRPDAARENTKVALILEELGLLDNAADFIRQAAAAASGPREWLGPYARILTRVRSYDEALAKLLEPQNGSAAREIGQAVATYYTPEERQAFATRLAALKQSTPPQPGSPFIAIADSARLYDLEVAWRLEQSVQPGGPGNPNVFGGTPYAPLQEQRMRYAELAGQLENLAVRIPAVNRLGVLTTAMRAYQSIGDSTSELRLFSANPDLQVNNRERYYQLLAQQRPDELLGIASRPSDLSNLMATQALINAGDQARSMQAIRNQGRSPVWTDAYTGLAGLYFGSSSTDVSAAFQRATGPLVIGDRLGKAVDRASQLAGNVWFYYGQRYAEYLHNVGQPQLSDDYARSEVESRPGDPGAYLELASYYKDVSQADRAITEFRRALELNSKRADLHSEIALLLWDSGRRNEAIVEWKAGLQKITAQPDPTMGARIIRDIRSRQQEGALHAEIDTALRSAAQTLQVWQLPNLLQAAFEKSTDDSWLIDVVQASRSPSQLLLNLTNLQSGEEWLSVQQRKRIFENAVSLLSTAVAANRFQYQQVRYQYLDFLLNHNDAAGARKVLDSLSAVERQSEVARQAELRLAAMENKIADLLARFSQNPLEAPSDQTLQQVGVTLARNGLSEASQRILEFLYSRQLERSSSKTAFLGLAEIRVQQGHLDQATDLLKRMNRLSPNPFDDLLASAQVFSRTGHPAEAAIFLKLRVQAAPWDTEARLELAKSEAALNQRNVADGDLQKVVSWREAPYDLRTQAAQEQAKSGSAPAGATGSRELDLMSNRIPLTPANADAPYFFAARVTAAGQTADAGVRVRLLTAAIAERPDDAPTRRLLLKAALDARQYHLAVAAYPRARFGETGDIEISAGLAEAHQQIGEFEEAARLFNAASSLETDSARKQALEDKATQAKASQDTSLENERRRPVMRAEVEQPNPVRRRIP